MLEYRLFLTTPRSTLATAFLICLLAALRLQLVLAPVRNDESIWLGSCDILMYDKLTAGISTVIINVSSFCNCCNSVIGYLLKNFHYLLRRFKFPVVSINCILMASKIVVTLFTNCLVIQMHAHNDYLFQILNNVIR